MKRETRADMEQLAAELEAALGAEQARQAFIIMLQRLGGRRFTFPTTADLDRVRRDAMIRRAYDKGFTPVQIAQSCNLSLRTIKSILNMEAKQ